MRIAILTGFFAAAALVGTAAQAADKASVLAVSCAEQWQKISTAPKLDRAAVKAYAAKCSAKTSDSGQGRTDPMRQDRLGACAARWAQMQAAHATEGQSYEVFSQQCLNGAPRA